MTDKHVEGADSGTKASEYDMTKIIEILSQQGKYKRLTLEEYELLSHRKPSVKKEDYVLVSFLLGITLAHQERLVMKLHLDLHLLLP